MNCYKLGFTTSHVIMFYTVFCISSTKAIMLIMQRRHKPLIAFEIAVLYNYHLFIVKRKRKKKHTSRDMNFRQRTIPIRGTM